MKKLVLDGSEAWYASSNAGVFYTTASQNLGIIYMAGKSSHFVYHFVNSVANLGHGEYLIDSVNRFTWFRDNDIATVSAWKAYLAQQYAAGTPVTVWYVLAEPEIGIVNEPLCKIGDYADTITVTADDVQITPAVGNDTLTVDTTIPPSAVTVVGHVKSRSVT